MKSNQLKLGAVLSYLSIGVNVLAALIYTPWMIAQIGKSQYGLFTLANSLITLFLIDFGLSSATSRYVSLYRAQGNQEKVDQFLGAVYKLYLLVDALIFFALLLVYFFIDQIYVKLTPAELAQFKVVYVIAASYALISFPFVTLNGILNAYEKFIQLKLADLIYRFLLVGLTIAALMCGFGLYGLVAINALSGLCVIGYKLIVIRRVTPVKVNFRRTEKQTYQDIFRFSVWTTIGALAQRLIFSITPSILGILADSSAIAVFGIVTTIEGQCYTVITAINGMFMPKISRIYAKTDTDQDIMPLMLRVGRFQYVLNGLLIVAFAVLGRSFINVWMGSDYQAGYYGTLLVILPNLFYFPLQIANTALVVQNKVKLQAGITVLIGVTNVVLSLVLTYFFGMIGACVSIFIAHTIRAVAYNIVYYKVLHLDIPYFIRKCYIRLLPPIAISIVAGIFLNRSMPWDSWTILCVKGCIVCAVYLCLVLWLGLSKSDRQAVRQKLAAYRRK